MTEADREREERLREPLSRWADKLIRKLKAERDTARAAHERLRQALLNDEAWFQTVNGRAQCAMCDGFAETRKDADVCHAPDCPLAPLETTR